MPISRNLIEEAYLGELKGELDAWEVRNPRAEYFSHQKSQELVAIITTSSNKFHYRVTHFGIIEILEKFAFLNNFTIKWFKRNKKE